MEVQTPQSTLIFLPHHVLAQRSCLLMGCVDTERHLVTITGTTSAGACQNGSSHSENVVQPVGLWLVGETSEEEAKVLKTCGLTRWYKEQLLFNLQKTNQTKSLPSVTYRTNAEENSDVRNTVIIVYEQSQVENAMFLSQNGTEHNREIGQTSIEFVSRSVSLSAKEGYSTHRKNGRSLGTRISTSLLNVFLVLAGCLVSLLDAAASNRFFRNSLVKNILSVPTLFNQLSHRYQCWRRVTTQQQALRHWNVLTKSVADVLLGIVVMVCLRSIDVEQVACVLMTWAEHVASVLQQLLHWMMGAPGGLKLNHNLTQFLGRFYLYHIHLWTGYLSLMKPILGRALWVIWLTGGCGATIQLSLVQDLLSMMTLHIYCFYVYAARLYSFQVAALGSLWRLFRGKKWNVLRKRVDSASYDVNQMFVGTLLFTILLFLLPTTMLYYVVFCTLRLLVLTVQGLLHRVMVFLNNVPVYLLLLWGCGSDVIKGNLKIQVVPSEQDGPLILTMQMLPVSLGTIWNEFLVQKTVSETWGSFIGKLTKGQLVYPWVEPNGN